jgi:hypothetical protein
MVKQNHYAEIVKEKITKISWKFLPVLVTLMSILGLFELFLMGF